MTQAWLEERLRNAGLRVEPTATYVQITRLGIMYNELEHIEAWRDYMARITAMRSDLVRELLVGTLDKFGNNNDNEKRAVLVYIDRMLSFVPELHAQQERLAKRKDEMERRAAPSGNIHWNDVLTPR